MDKGSFCQDEDRPQGKGPCLLGLCCREPAGRAWPPGGAQHPRRAEANQESSRCARIPTLGRPCPRLEQLAGFLWRPRKIQTVPSTLLVPYLRRPLAAPAFLNGQQGPLGTRDPQPVGCCISHWQNAGLMEYIVMAFLVRLAAWSQSLERDLC